MNGSFEKFKGVKETPEARIQSLKMAVDKENKEIASELRELMKGKKEVRGEERKTLEFRESYLRADLAATQKAQEILVRGAKNKIDSFGVPESVLLLSTENGWRGSDSTLGEVRFTKEGVENLETYFKGLERLSGQDPERVLNAPLVVHKAASFLYEDRRRNPIPFGDGLRKVLSRMKPEEEVRWATDVDNVTIVLEREKITKKDYGGIHEYPTEVVQVRVEIRGAR